ncbi:zinc finger BED domain-containing protein 4-like [Uranotaenia lowii]|uniref:zinc finger BED domain-containing protein 4-like n=1 Tax=Uranotaenia lowii TaxID=190385 RepID=UPI002479A1F7|nr:zinc finger BED domain-containing protein 4-like [Uranotaenia lowii]
MSTGQSGQRKHQETPQHNQVSKKKQPNSKATPSHALSKLHEMQQNLNRPVLKLKQDVPTRWNSTYDMLDRLLRNKEPVVSTLALLESDLSLESHDWIEIDHAVKVLKVFYDVTVEISSEKNVSLSKIAVLSRLMTRYVRQYLDREKSVPENIQKLCEQLISGLAKRFSLLESNELVAQSILLDPRFKKQGFGDDDKYQSAYQSLIRKIRMTSIEPMPEPMELTHTHAASPAVAAIIELDKYVAELHLQRKNDPLLWWEERKSVYPRLYQMVLKRLCIPATSVPCERIFSKAGQICNDRRSRLSSSNMQKIIFVNHNIN